MLMLYVKQKCSELQIFFIYDGWIILPGLGRRHSSDRLLRGIIHYTAHILFVRYTHWLSEEWIYEWHNRRPVIKEKVFMKLLCINVAGSYSIADFFPFIHSLQYKSYLYRSLQSVCFKSFIYTFRFVTKLKVRNSD